MKKGMRYLLIAVMVLAFAALAGRGSTLTVSASTSYSVPSPKIVDWGKCGNNVYWSLYDYHSEYTLMITGKGEMSNFTYYSAPWNRYKNTLNRVVISAGITSIGTNSFYYYQGLRDVSIGPDVKVIGSNAFSGCYSLMDLTVGNQVTELGLGSLATGNHIHYCGTRQEWDVLKGSAAARFASVTFAYDSAYDLTHNGEITIESKKYVYNMDPKTPNVTVKIEGKTLKKGTDYTLTFSNNVNAGMATVTATGKGEYRGAATAQFLINPKKISDEFVPKASDTGYTGNAILQSFRITVKFNNDKTTVLQEKRDYSITYSDNINAGKATATITGTGNYTGSVKRTFQIEPLSIEKATLTNVYDKSYTGEEVTQTPTVRLYVNFRSYTLRNGTDYSLSYKNNKSAGKATVIVTGKGNFKGTVSKEFNITKGAPTVKFEHDTIVSNKIGATYTNKITTASKGKKTYQSSNSNVAKVNSKGEVTTKGYGQATITVSIAATDDFKETTARYTIIVNKTIGWSDLRYSFCNRRSDFGYSRNYKIPYSRYKMAFGINADSVYRQHGDSLWGGNCFGMSTSTSLMNNSNCSIKMKEFKSTAKKVSDLRLTNHSDRHDLTLLQYIEVMQISQYSSARSRVEWQYWNKLEDIVNEVRKVASNSEPVVICMYQDHSGHAVVGYEIEKVDSEKTRIRIYDPNFPDEKRNITLYTSNGKYTGWYYKLNGTENWGSKYSGDISCVPYSTYKNLWDGNNQPLNSIVTNSLNFEIQDKNGNKVAEMADGRFTSRSEQINELIPLDLETDTITIAMPVGNYRFINKQEDMESLTLTTLDTVLSLNAENTLMTASINTDGSVSMVNLEPSSKADYAVTFDSLLLQSQGIEELTFAGVGKGDPLMVGVEDGQYVFENCEELKVFVNGEIVEEHVPGGASDSNSDEPVGKGN